MVFFVCVILIFYGRFALWPIHFVVKTLATKVLMAKPPRTLGQRSPEEEKQGIVGAGESE